MKIVAPISRVDEVATLAEAGADELYCGVLPDAWTRRFRNSGANRRIFGNLGSLDDLRAALDQARQAGCRLSLVMNAQHYAGEQLPWLLDMAQWFDDHGGHALIVSDAMLLTRLAERPLALRLHLSSVAACRNAEAAGFFAELGAHRIVLPRDVRRDEVVRLVENLPGLEFEAFVLNDGCVFEEGHCQTLHLPDKLGGPICLDRYTNRYRRRDGRELRAWETEALAANERAYADWLWYRFGCGFSTTGAGDPLGPCGLCAMPDFAAAGLTAVKIAGREADSERKRRSVAMVQQIRTLSRQAAVGEADRIRQYAAGLRSLPWHCAGGFMCYYPEVAAAAPAAADRPVVRKNSIRGPDSGGASPDSIRKTSR